MPPVEVICEVVVCALVVGPRGLVWSITLIDPGAARPDAADATDLQKSALGWRSSVRGVVGPGQYGNRPRSSGAARARRGRGGPHTSGSTETWGWCTGAQNSAAEGARRPNCRMRVCSHVEVANRRQGGSHGVNSLTRYRPPKPLVKHLWYSFCARAPWRFCRGRRAGRLAAMQDCYGGGGRATAVNGVPLCGARPSSHRSPRPRSAPSRPVPGGTRGSGAHRCPSRIR